MPIKGNALKTSFQHLELLSWHSPLSTCLTKSPAQGNPNVQLKLRGNQGLTELVFHVSWRGNCSICSSCLRHDMNITKNQEGETQQNRHNRNIPVPSRPIWGITRVLAFKGKVPVISFLQDISWLISKDWNLCFVLRPPLRVPEAKIQP